MSSRVFRTISFLLMSLRAATMSLDWDSEWMERGGKGWFTSKEEEEEELEEEMVLKWAWRRDKGEGGMMSSGSGSRMEGV